MLDTEIFRFDIAGDRFLDETLAIAYCNWCSKDGRKFYGWREKDGVLYFYDSNHNLEKFDIHLFPAPLTDVKNIIIEWLKNQEWDEKGQDFDVNYHRGWRIYNNVPYSDMSGPDRYQIGFAVQPHWTEYHK